jgi:hypothetical protein
MKARVWPDEHMEVVLKAAGWPRGKFIRFVLQRMRSQENFGVKGCRVFLIPDCRPPLNSFVMSPGGFIYLPQEWIPQLGELKRIKVPTITGNSDAQTAALAKAQKYIPAWLAVTMATDAEHARRLHTFANIAVLWAESMASSDEAAFSA